MAVHWDALNLPEGVERTAHEHVWAVTHEGALPKEKHGRPICTVCRGKPSFFELKEVEDGSSELELALKHGQYIRIERTWPEGILAEEADVTGESTTVEIPSAPESARLQEHWDDLREALNLPKLSDEKLREFVDDYVSGRIFTTAHLRDSEADMIPMIFMPLALGCFSKVQPDTLSQIGVIYEYYERAGRLNVNGKPTFFSFHMLHIDDWERAKPAIERELERRKSIEL